MAALAVHVTPSLVVDCFAAEHNLHKILERHAACSLTEHDRSLVHEQVQEVAVDALRRVGEHAQLSPAL
eukprot:9758144-Alexandrium_andersonii.AAC.1